MQKLILLSLFVFVVIIGCSSAPDSVSEQKDLSFLTRGVWLGILPCSDCDKIDYQINFKSDYTFIQKSVYKGKSDDQIVEEGTWSFLSDSIISLEDLDETKMFLIGKNELIILDPEGNRFDPSIEERYHITKDSKNIKKIEPPKEIPEVNEGFYQDKFLNGIDFIARGNEPNWNLEIDFEKSMLFKTMDGITLTTPFVEGTNNPKEGITNYQAKTDSGELKVTLTLGSCQDNMSGEYFTHSVKVEIKKNNDKNYTIFSGCGKYLFDHRLNDTWIMNSLSGVNLKKAKLTKGFPTFEFKLSEMKFSGHAGCNSLNGNITLSGDKIKFENMIGTLMICPDMKVERTIIDAFNQKTFTYKIDKEKLFLESGKTKMVFKKGD